MTVSQKPKPKLKSKLVCFSKQIIVKPKKGYDCQIENNDDDKLYDWWSD